MMREIMKLRKVSVCCFALLLVNAIRSSSQTGELKQELQIYHHQTQIGVIARRTFSDSRGRVLKSIYYTGSEDATVPYTEAMLKPVSISLNKYDDQDRVIRSEVYDSRMTLSSYTEIKYVNEQERRETLYTAAGVRTYEIRFVGRRTVAHLYFDETGKQLVAIRGQIPGDLPFGWGETETGLACGITVTYHHATVDLRAGYAVQVNFKNSNSDCIQIPELPPADIELRDAAGRIVTTQVTGKDRWQASREYGYVICAGEAGNTYPPYELSFRYPNLSPGRYSVRVRQAMPGRDRPLMSNAVTFEVSDASR
jgi:hypothetical protein